MQKKQNKIAGNTKTTAQGRKTENSIIRSFAEKTDVPPPF